MRLSSREMSSLELAARWATPPGIKRIRKMRLNLEDSRLFRCILEPGTRTRGGGPIQAGSVSSIVTAGAVTYTGAQIYGGTIVRDPSGASRIDALPTAANLIAAVPGARVGDVIRCTLKNGADAAETITLTLGAGMTRMSGDASSLVIAQDTSRTLIFQITNVTAGSEAVTFSA
jgi:hypothetical protein